MTGNEARQWLAGVSLAVTALLFVFCMIAPAFGYPLTFDQTPRLIEIVLPVFLGYLGSATLFLTQKPGNKDALRQHAGTNITKILVKGPVVVSGILIVVILFAFGYSNRASAAPGIGMNIDQLAASLAGVMGILTVTTNIIVSMVFNPQEGTEIAKKT